MAQVFKIIATEGFCNSTAQSYSNNRNIRLMETGGTVRVLITRRDAANAILGTISLKAGTEMVLLKDPTDTLESNSAIVTAVPVGITG